MTLLYAKEFHMLEGLNDEELENYLEENPRIVPLFKIDIIQAADTYITLAMVGEDRCEPDIEVLMELHIRMRNGDFLMSYDISVGRNQSWNYRGTPTTVFPL